MKREYRPRGAAPTSTFPADAFILSPTSTARAEEALAAIGSHLDFVLGDVRGYAHVASKPGGGASRPERRPSDWEQHAFQWPDDRRQVIEFLWQRHLEGREAYVCPNVLRTRARAVDTGVRHQLLHADIDHANFRPKQAEDLGAYVVSSGRPGHLHLYLKLRHPVSLRQYNVLMRGLDKFVNGDHKIHDHEVLRVPGTCNYKQQLMPRPVHSSTKWPVKEWAPEEAAALLGVDLLGEAMHTSETHVIPQEDICVSQVDIDLTLLDPRFRSMVVTGDIGRYRSRSEARLAVACHVLQKGFSFTTFEALMTDPNHACSEWFDGRSVGQALSRDWSKAREFVRENPAIRSKPEARAYIEGIQGLAARPWPDRTGSTDQLVLLALLDKAHTLGAIEVDASVRELADLSACDRSTVSRSLKRLADAGWVTTVHNEKAQNRMASTHRVLMPDLQPSKLPQAPHSVPPHDYWAATGSTGRQIFAELSTAPSTTSELVARTQKARATVDRHCRRLQKDGLLTRSSSKRWEVVPTSPEDLEKLLGRLSDEFGFAGRLQERSDRYEREREGFLHMTESSRDTSADIRAAL